MRLATLFGLLLATMISISSAAPDKKNARLVTTEKEKTYRSLLPKTNDPAFEDLKKEHLIFYDDTVIVPAYQMWNSASNARGEISFAGTGLHWPGINISGGAAESAKGDGHGGNANVEFPWLKPAGNALSSNTSSFKFVKLPGPIVVERKVLPRNPSNRDQEMPAFVWTYPEGTIFGEVLVIKDAKQREFAYEVRTRAKKDGKWDPTVYRPFTKKSDLEKVLNVALTPVSKKEVRLTDAAEHPTQKVLDVTSTEWELKDLGQDLAGHLLKETTFKKDNGTGWDGPETALTTKADFNIVPKNYKGGHFTIGKGSCMTCHEGTLKHADQFDSGRDWYGRVRGSDNIFSFHPFANESISKNNTSAKIYWRKELFDAGLIIEK